MAILRQTNLQNESAEYTEKRRQLGEAELAEMRERERVAELRRHLPEGPSLQDYVFQEGPQDLAAGDDPVCETRLSGLFTAPDRTLIVYQMMYGKKQTTPCPMCTSFVDCLNGVAKHIRQRADLAVIVAAGVPAIRDFARSRGWNDVRFLSCADNSFRYDLASEDREGNQDSCVSVFTLDRDGTPRLFYSVHPRMADDVKERGQDLLNPIWNYLDLTREGRGDFYAKLSYPSK